MVKYILFLDKLEGEGRLFWRGKSISHIGGVGIVNYYKSVHHPIPTRGNREHPANFQNKSVRSPLNWVSQFFLFLPKLKGRGKHFFEVYKNVDHIIRFPSRVLGCHKR